MIFQIYIVIRYRMIYVRIVTGSAVYNNKTQILPAV